MWDSINSSRNDTADLDDNLDLFARVYEMEPSGRQLPWPGCSDVFVPIVPAFIDDIAADIVSMILSPGDIWVVNGKDADSRKYASVVENYYNTWLIERYIPRLIYLTSIVGLRDGTYVWELLWNRKVAEIPVLHRVPRVDPETGDEMLEPFGDEMVPVYDITAEKVTQVVENDVDWRLVELKDCKVIPAWAMRQKDAFGIAIKLWLTEDDLWALVESGEFDKDAVEFIIGSVAPGSSELNKDPASHYTRTAGGQVAIGSESGSQDATRKKQRGPYEIWRCYTKQFKFGPDKRALPLVVYVHEDTHMNMGTHAYDYWLEDWPIVIGGFMDRPLSMYKYAVTERLLAIQLEGNSIHNHRNDMVDLYLSPPRYHVEGARPMDPNMPWGPDADWVVTSPNDVGTIKFGDIPQSAVQEEQMLMSYAERMFGGSSAAPMGQALSKGDKQQRQQRADLRKSLMAMNYRWSLQEAFHIIHQLKVQFSDDWLTANNFNTGKEVELPRGIMALPYKHTVAGIGGSLDMQMRRDTALMKYHLFQNDPVFADYMQHWKLVRGVLVSIEEPDIEGLMGTEDEAKQKAQQMQAQQLTEKQKAEVLQMISLMMGHAPGTVQQPSGAQRRRQRKGRTNPSPPAIGQS